MSKFLLLLPLIFLFLLGFHNIVGMDQDLGRHLLTGNIILQTKTIPATNLFSYTYSTFPFINHHWLSEVILAATYNLFGFGGLFILQFLLLIIPFCLIFFYSLRRGANIFIVGITSLFYLNILVERIHLRPELFSFLLLSFYLIILYQFREKYTRIIFILPFLQLFWVNLHIYFLIGIVAVGLFFVEILITQRKKIKSFISHTSPLPVQIIAIGSVFGGVILASLLNPNGLTGMLYPLFIFNNYGYSIEENQNIFFLWNYSQKPTILFFVLAVIFLWTGIISARKKVRLIDIFLSITFTILGTIQIRNFPLFVYATYIPAVFVWTQLSPSLLRLFSKKRSILFFILMIFCFGLFWYGIKTTYEKVNFGYGAIEEGKNALTFFEKNNIKGPIFNNFDIGSYIAYRLYPREKVFVDGRPEAYPASFFEKEYIPMQKNKEVFKKLSAKHAFNVIIFSHTDQTPWAQTFLPEIITNEQWKPVFLDSNYIILVKDTKENKKIIDTFSFSEKNFNIMRLTKEYDFYKLAHFFYVVSWEKQEEKVWQLLLQKDPSSCVALRNLYSILYKRRDPGIAAFSARLQNCK